MSFLEFVKRIDFFGKEPEFYIQGRPKQVSIFGRIFTYIFIFLYILIFCYKLYRMSQRVDITFYDSYSNTDEVPNIKITQDNFTLMFAILDENGEPFIDDTIYYPEAFFSDEYSEEIRIERCSPDKIGPRYREFFDDSEILDYYCLVDVNYSLVPNMNSLRISIYPCRNNEDDDYCESQEYIENYLSNKLFLVYFQDIMLTPLDYHNPIKERINFLNTEIYKNLGQYLHTEMQLVKIETSTNIIGFDFLTKPKIEEFIKFDKEVILPFPGYNFDDEEDEYPITIFELQLNDRILLEKRYYVQLIDVLGEIGGFMEIMFSFFSMICSLIVDILYEKTLTNNLFTYNITRKTILIKKRGNPIFKINKDKDTKIEEPNSSEVTIFPTKRKKNKNKKKVMIVNTEIKYINNKNSEEKYLAKNKNKVDVSSFKKETKIKNIDIQSVKSSYDDINKNDLESIYNMSKKSKNSTDNTNNWIIEEISLKDLLISVFYCCGKKRRKMYNMLLNEGMKVIIEKLDISNIFKNIYSIECSNNDFCKSMNIIKMSGECVKALSEIS